MFMLICIIWVLSYTHITLNTFMPAKEFEIVRLQSPTRCSELKSKPESHQQTSKPLAIAFADYAASDKKKFLDLIKPAAGMDTNYRYHICDVDDGNLEQKGDEAQWLKIEGINGEIVGSNLTRSTHKLSPLCFCARRLTLGYSKGVVQVTLGKSLSKVTLLQIYSSMPTQN